MLPPPLPPELASRLRAALSRAVALDLLSPLGTQYAITHLTTGVLEGERVGLGETTTTNAAAYWAEWTMRWVMIGDFREASADLSHCERALDALTHEL